MNQKASFESVFSLNQSFYPLYIYLLSIFPHFLYPFLSMNLLYPKPTLVSCTYDTFLFPWALYLLYSNTPNILLFKNIS